MVEITFTANQDYRDEFMKSPSTPCLRPRGRTLEVPAFWAGGRAWKVRYASTAVGARWRSICSVPGRRGLHGIRAR